LPSPAVLDSSAVLALLQNEAGSETVSQLICGALVSAVNLTEVHSKLIGKGIPAPLSWKKIASLQCDVCSYTGEQARIAAELMPITRSYGLSLGDRACLALAIERKATVYTTAKVWKKLSLGIEVEVIR
jgi:PIN domain nuclease of toxin-antitoxin system